MTRTHIDLFAGLAGFSLAAAANGVQTVMQVENNPFLLAGLKCAWPQSQHHDDIKTFDARPYRGIWAVMGGPPCQSASRAGKQRGKADDRWLWDEAIRVVEESQPTWFLFENVAGLTDVGLDGILAKMGRLGYETQPLSIPACAVDSPQDRERIWILGHRCGEGLAVGNVYPGVSKGAGRTNQGQVASLATQGELVADIQSVNDGGKESRWRPQGRIAVERNAENGAMADGDAERLQGAEYQSLQERANSRTSIGTQPASSPWSDFEWLPCADNIVRRVPAQFHDLAYGVHDRIPRKLRAKLIGALGNSIVPQIATQIIASMIKSEQ